MQSNNDVNKILQEENYPSAYREVKIGKTLYCVTSVFTGEKELAPTLERLAARRVLVDIDAKARNIIE